MDATRTLIRGACLLTMDPVLGEVDAGDLLIEGTRIAAVGRSLDVADAMVVDATDMIAIPGFVDTHRHVWQTQLRTVATDWSLFNYFSQMRCIYSTFYEPEDAYLGNYAGALEALNAGITTVVDHCHIINSPAHADAAIDGLRDAGVRGIFCYGLFPNPTHRPFALTMDPGWRVEDARRVRRERLTSDEALLQFGLAPGEVEGQPLDMTASQVRLARDLGARRISCHVAMGAYDRGGHAVAWLHDGGMLAEDVLLVHGAALTDAELRAAADAGACISSTPETELQMAMGHPVAFRARAHGVAVGLGIDIVSNYSGDMFAPMRLLLQAERGFANAGRAAPPRAIAPLAREVLALATIEGARVAGLDQVVGSLTPGKQADVVLLRTDAIHMTPVIDPIGAVVLYANVHDVESVWVAGKPMKRSGQLAGVDWPAVRARLRASSARIVAGFRSVPLAEIEAFAAAVML